MNWHVCTLYMGIIELHTYDFGVTGCGGVSDQHFIHLYDNWYSSVGGSKLNFEKKFLAFWRVKL